MIMRRFACFGGFVVVSLLIFSPSILADRVDSFTDPADSFFDSSIHFTDADSASVDSYSAFFESRTSGSNEDHLNWLEDFDDHHGRAWGWHKHHNGDGDSGGNFGNQDNGDTNDDSGNGDTNDDSGNTGSSGGASTVAVPEPSVLVLLSAALAAFLLKSLRRATV